ncbi:MAG: hypothetical protein BRD55_09925 [Bacteroidetes bacterium SW_9_63_38]|nr:MAG: hypothetical protein BRD55_09925 [Bacteroidetes bacterium SW_9_63_38]
MTASSPDSADGRLVQTAHTVAALAHQLSRGVAVLTVMSAAAGLLLWSLLWWPPSSTLSPLIGASLTLGLLLAPAAVLALFYQGLRDLLALPDRIASHTRRTVDQSTEAARSVVDDRYMGVLGRTWGVVTQIWQLRTVLLDNRDLLLRYGLLFRFLNPGFLLLVVGATILSLLLIPLSLLTALVVSLL